MAAFTYLWTIECRSNMRDSGYEGRPLDFAAGNSFLKRGINPRGGDFVYVVGVYTGAVYLVGRMKVTRVWDRADWDARFDTPTLWEGTEVIQGEEGTPMRFNRTLTRQEVARLQFINGRCQVVGIQIDATGWFNPQSLRNVRRLTSATAALLDGILLRNL